MPAGGLRVYLPEHNERFARRPPRAENYHRRAPRAAELDRIFRLESERVVTQLKKGSFLTRFDTRYTGI